MAGLERIALGCGNFGGIGSAPAFYGRGEPEAEAVAIMDAAWALGIRRFDTADAYGGGRSESWIGGWISSTGQRPAITTKTFNPMSVDGDSGLSRDRVLRQIETSLERLGLDSVELYLMHEAPDVPVAEAVGTFEEVVASGLVDAWGASNVDAAQLGEILEHGRPSLVQNSFSLLDATDEQEVLPLCAEHGVAYQAFGPLAGGWLTGKYRRGERYPAGSRMTQRPEAYRSFEDERVFDGLDRLGAEAASRGVSMGALALAWALSEATLDSVVVGPRRPEHLRLVPDALALSLTAGERAALRSWFA